MKSEIKEATGGLNFPCFARHKELKSVVMFLSEEAGIVVKGVGVKGYQPFYFADNWVRIRNSDVWEILPAGTQLILTQE